MSTNVKSVEPHAVKDTVNPKDAPAGENDNEQAKEARVRAIAVEHALNIQEKKNMQNKVLDMILAAFDLPSQATADPAHPSSTDADAFRDCLALFRPSDLDELIRERNIDRRCGYALCNSPNKKEKRTLVWDNKEGKMISRSTEGKWCSPGCKDKHDFVRHQLGTEPAWLRQTQNNHVRLLTDTFLPQTDSEQPQQMSNRIEVGRQQELALERGSTKARSLGDITLFERETTSESKPPRIVPEITVGDVLEGMPIRPRNKH